MLKISPVPVFNDNYIWVLHTPTHALVVDPGDAGPICAWLAAQQLVLAGVLLAVLAAASVRALGGSRALLLLGAVPGCIGITLFTAIYRENVFRFTLPALPIFSVLAGWGISVLWQRYSAGPRTV